MKWLNMLMLHPECLGWHPSLSTTNLPAKLLKLYVPQHPL